MFFRRVFGERVYKIWPIRTKVQNPGSSIDIKSKSKPPTDFASFQTCAFGFSTLLQVSFGPGGSWVAKAPGSYMKYPSSNLWFVVINGIDPKSSTILGLSHFPGNSRESLKIPGKYPFLGNPKIRENQHH